MKAAVKDGSFQRDVPPSMIKETIFTTMRDDINDEQKKQLLAEYHQNYEKAKNAEKQSLGPF